MIPALIVLFGTALVVAAIIGLRLPAFLALIGAGLLVVSITPADYRLRSAHSAARSQAMIVEKFDPGTGVVSFAENTLRYFVPGKVRMLRGAEEQPRDGSLVRENKVFHFQSGEALHPGDRLVSEARWLQAEEEAKLNPGEVVAQGFGKTVIDIGLLIALASIIGACLLESGAAERIVLWIRGIFGEERASLALVPSGFLLCIPAFFDTVFYLLMPIAKSLRQRTGKDYLLYILSVVAGTTMAHSLVPPTPGPLFVSGALHVEIATMMAGGAIVGLCAAGCGYLYALWANRRWDIPLNDLPAEGGSLEVTRPLPSLGWSLLPIFLPILLIAAESLTGRGRLTGPAREWIAFFGNKNLALALGALVALILLAGMRQWKWRTLAQPLNHALESAGVILLITPAGGAFGQALRATDISGVLSSWFAGSGGWLLPAAFGVTMLVRLAQGSATVAMITGAGIVAPLALGVHLGYHPVYLALAIGCGSKPIPWMNDSGFWIISKMSGMSETQTLKTASVMMGVMGFSGFAVTLLGAWLFPLV